MPLIRPRRLRHHQNLRDIVRETHLHVNDLVQPLFIIQGHNQVRPIASMPGQFQYSPDQAVAKVQELAAIGIKAVLLFGISTEKDAHGSAALRDDGVVQQAIAAIKRAAPEMLVIADLCFCDYTDHGHCGVLHPKGHVDNDATLPLLGMQAVSLAKAGADVIAPSGMMYGMVFAIREHLDMAGYVDTAILSYAVKYASQFYSPFRAATDGAPRFGDRRGYQSDPANISDALREARLDQEEGADMLMVKPAHTYLDIIYRVKQHCPELPLFAYHTSGEAALLHCALAAGLISEDAVLEVHLAIKRAGANAIITYFAEWLAQRIANSTASL